MVAHRLEQPERAHGVDVGGVFRHIERYPHVALSTEIVDLVRGDLFQDVSQRGAVGQVAVMERELETAVVRIMVNLIDAVGVEQASPANYPVDLIAFLEEKSGEIGPVLAGHAGDQGSLRTRLG